MKTKTILTTAVMFVLVASLVYAADITSKAGDLYLDGKLGIGTTTPGTKLDVDGKLRLDTTETIDLLQMGANYRYGMGVSDAYLRLYSHNSGLGTQIGSYNGATFTPKLTVLNSGDIGIGTAAPAHKLDVAPQNSRVAASYTYLDNSIDADNAFTRSNFGSNVYWNPSTNLWTVRAIGANDFSAIVHPNGDGLAFITAANTGNTARTLTNKQFYANERMRINRNGNVGIGTNDPAGGKLVIANSPVGEGGWLVPLKFEGAHGMIYLPSGGIGFGLHGNKNFYWRDVAGTKYAMILNAVTGKLDVFGNIKHKAGANDVEMTNAFPAGTTKYLEYVINGAAWGVSMWASSERFKENIKDLELDSSKIYDLNPVSFNWKPDRGGKEDFGLIAEEVIEILPLLAVTDKDGKPFSVRYDVLSVLLLNELQKKNIEINDIKERLEALENK